MALKQSIHLRIYYIKFRYKHQKLFLTKYIFNLNCCHQVILSQKEGHYFNQDETLRLSKECRMFFKNIFISEKKRKEISDLKNEEWMTKMSQLIDIPYFEK